MNTQNKMINISQKIFNPSQYKLSSSGINSLATFNRENFGRVMAESISKAINSVEVPPKEKHVRKILIGTFQAESGEFFFNIMPTLRLKENQIVCWKFCHVLHRILRDGHRKVVSSSFERRQLLLDCGNMWRHVDGYGQLIYKYCLLLYNRTNFLVRNPLFPNDLKVTDEQLDEIGEHDTNVFFDLSCEMFDALEDILKLEDLVLNTLDIKKYNSLSTTGRCHLTPLVACIQDSTLLYDYLVKILFKLHGALPASTLEGHRERFLSQHKSLKNFYFASSNLQFFKNLIQVPHLADRTPNFLIASDLGHHVAPQAVMISDPAERESPDDSRGIVAEELLVNFDTNDSADFSRDHTSLPATGSLNQPSQQPQPSCSREETRKPRDEDLEKIRSLEEQVTNLVLDKSKEQEIYIGKEKILLESIMELENSIQTKESELEQKNIRIAELEVTNTKLTSDMKSQKYEHETLKKGVSKLQESHDRAVHDSEINQEAVKRVMKELNDLKKNRLAPAPLPPPSQPTPILIPKPVQQVAVDEALENKTNEEAVKRVMQELKELNELRKSQVAETFNRHIHTSNVDEKTKKFLLHAMEESEKIIRQASKEIKELSEKPRKPGDSSVRLQVRLIELEILLTKEWLKLGALRKRHAINEQEDALSS